MQNAFRMGKFNTQKGIFEWDKKNYFFLIENKTKKLRVKDINSPQKLTFDLDKKWVNMKVEKWGDDYFYLVILNQFNGGNITKAVKIIQQREPTLKPSIFEETDKTVSFIGTDDLRQLFDAAKRGVHTIVTDLPAGVPFRIQIQEVKTGIKENTIEFFIIEY